MKSLRVGMSLLQIQICFLLFQLVTPKETVFVEKSLPSHAFPVIISFIVICWHYLRITCIDITLKCTFHCYLLAFLVANSSHF